MATGRDDDKADVSERKSLELPDGIARVGDNADVRTPFSDCSHDLLARAVVEFDVDIGVS